MHSSLFILFILFCFPERNSDALIYFFLMLFSCVRNETGCGKFALRALSQCLAREFQPLGVHVAHVIIDGLVGPPRFSCISINQVYIILYSFSLIEESSIDACIPTNILLAITIHFIYIYIINFLSLYLQ